MRSTFSVVLFPLDEKRAVWLRPVSKRLSHKGRHEAANTFDWRRLLLFTSSVWFGFRKFCIKIAKRQQTVFCLDQFFTFTFFHLSFFMHILRVYHTAFIMSAKQQIWHHIFLFKRSPLTLKSIKYFFHFWFAGEGRANLQWGSAEWKWSKKTSRRRSQQVWYVENKGKYSQQVKHVESKGKCSQRESIGRTCRKQRQK